MYGKLKATNTNILNCINEYDIFRYYISNFKELNVLFCSELRKDINPTCSIRKYDKLIYADFADVNSVGIDCFKYVMLKYNLNYYRALDKICIDFNLPLMVNCPYLDYNKCNHVPILYNLDLSKIPSKEMSSIQVKLKNFTLVDKNYWKDKYDISVKDLKKFNVYPVQYFIHKSEFIEPDTVCYGYYFGKEIMTGIDLWKIYTPFADKKVKWRTNCGNDVVQGFNQLPEFGDVLIITKSLKDIIVLSKIGIPAVAPQAENHLIPLDIILELKKRFKFIFVLFDNDDAGIKASVKYHNEYGFFYFYMPLELEIKDPADVVEYYDYKLLKDLIDASINSKMGK
jgi:hypothetical protein